MFLTSQRLHPGMGLAWGLSQWSHGFCYKRHLCAIKHRCIRHTDQKLAACQGRFLSLLCLRPWQPICPSGIGKEMAQIPPWPVCLQPPVTSVKKGQGSLTASLFQ